MQHARFVVLTIKNTIQPSGQSVCLQAMACGKAVIINDFPGLWNRELLRNGQTCIIAGPPGLHSSIQDAVERLLADRELTIAIGTNARKVVESDLNVNSMAKGMAVDLEKLLASK
jgi:glycosyltransferase involved in cell wall biosynthesis